MDITNNVSCISANMHRFQRSMLLICLTLASLTLVTSQLYAKEQSLDVAIIIDTSGSMGKNDPHKLRTEAAKLFVSLLDRKDRVSLVSFSGRAYPVTRFLSLNERRNEQKLIKSIDQLITNGKFTNLHDALLRGYELLTKTSKKGHAKHIILMSDGRMDLGNEERNLRLLEKTLDELTPKLSKADIKVHTVAFTKKAYIPLLKLAAEDTQGQFILLENANGVHQVFETLFERTKTPEMLPLTEDSFVLDKSVKELTIVATKFKPYSNITISAPDGEDLSKKNLNDNVKWFASKQFDLITIKNPAKGYWLVKYSEGGNKAYIITDFKLEATSTKRHAEPGSPLQIQAYLSKKDRKIKRKSLLRSTEFKVKVTSPVGVVIENLLIDDGSEIGSERNDGIYGISYAFELEGTYKLEVTAKGQTFDRKKTLFIDVKSTNPHLPFAKAKADREQQAQFERERELEAQRIAAEEAEKARLEIEALEAEKRAAEAKTAKEKHAKPGHDGEDTHAASTDKHDKPALSVDTHDSTEQAIALDEHGVPIVKQQTDHADETLDEKAEPDGLGLGDALFAFFMFNVFLGIFGGGGYYFYKKKLNQKSKNIEKSDTDSHDDKKSKSNDKSDKNAVDLSTEAEVGSEFGHMDDEHEKIDLDAEESISDAITDIDLADELSSILEETDAEAAPVETTPDNDDAASSIDDIDDLDSGIDVDPEKEK